MVSNILVKYWLPIIHIKTLGFKVLEGRNSAFLALATYLYTQENAEHTKNMS